MGARPYHEAPFSDRVLRGTAAIRARAAFQNAFSLAAFQGAITPRVDGLVAALVVSPCWTLTVASSKTLLSTPMLFSTDARFLAMIPTSVILLISVAFSAAAPAAIPVAPAATVIIATAETPSEAALATGVGSVGFPFSIEAVEENEDEVLEGELGAGEDMEGAENIVFRPLFRYRERTPARRRVRNSNRRRDTNYHRTYAARFPHRSYRPLSKRRTVPYVRHQILY